MTRKQEAHGRTHAHGEKRKCCRPVATGKRSATYEGWNTSGETSAHHRTVARGLFITQEWTAAQERRTCSGRSPGGAVTSLSFEEPTHHSCQHTHNLRPPAHSQFPANPQRVGSPQQKKGMHTVLVINRGITGPRQPVHMTVRPITSLLEYLPVKPSQETLAIDLFLSDEDK